MNKQKERKQQKQFIVPQEVRTCYCEMCGEAISREEKDRFNNSCYDCWSEFGETGLCYEELG